MNIEPTDLEKLSYPALGKLALAALEDHPSGLTEYELIQWIKKQGYRQFENARFWDRLSLFQTHFMLFHTLYQLKTLLVKTNNITLEINVLKIRLLPTKVTNSSELTDFDPLQEYYLDLSHLHDTTDEDIAELLSKFWQTMGAVDKRAAALEELELEDPVDFVVIKQQHRRLVMEHHPDRGGSKEKLQAINTAMDILKQLEDTG